MHSNILKAITSLALIVSITVCIEQNVECNINGVEINDALIGTERKEILRLFGVPSQSDLEIKGFEDYSYVMNHKKYGLILHYEFSKGGYRIASYKCIKAKLKIEIFNQVFGIDDS